LRPCTPSSKPVPLTPSQTRDLLDTLGHRPRKPLGQNFLIDGNIVRKSLQLAGVQPNDTVIEIGPGLGTLTEALLEKGARVHAVELDSLLTAHLRQSLLPRFPDTFHLLEGDAVDHPLAGCDTGTSLKIVANLPYAITSPWMENLLTGLLPECMVLMMQKEAADRLTAQPGSKAYSAVSIFLSAAYERSHLHKVARSCFYPVPGVDSCLLHLVRKAQPVTFSKGSRELIRSLFTQRRKQIRALMAPYPHLQPWLDQLPGFGASPASRPEAIPLKAYLALDRYLPLDNP
jgi:16S rRNA (adenine1518-N6/adenine1519-N6)-dimethyltransferase